MLIGERPPGPARPRRSRAPRARLSGLTVDPSGIAWRTWWGRRGWVAAHQVAAVAVVDCAHWTNPSYVHRYAVLLDRDGGPLLRVASTDDRRRRAVLAPLAAAVTYETTAASQAKDYRRRWPEAFGWVHAHTVLTGVGLFGVWCIAVAIAQQSSGG